MYTYFAAQFSTFGSWQDSSADVKPMFVRFQSAVRMISRKNFVKYSEVYCRRTAFLHTKKSSRIRLNQFDPEATFFADRLQDEHGVAMNAVCLA